MHFITDSVRRSSRDPCYSRTSHYRQLTFKAIRTALATGCCFWMKQQQRSRSLPALLVLDEQRLCRSSKLRLGFRPRARSGSFQRQPRLTLRDHSRAVATETLHGAAGLFLPRPQREPAACRVHLDGAGWQGWQTTSTPANGVGVRGGSVCSCRRVERAQAALSVSKPHSAQQAAPFIRLRRFSPILCHRLPIIRSVQGQTPALGAGSAEVRCLGRSWAVTRCRRCF